MSGPHIRRDPLIGSALARSLIDLIPPGTTGVPLRLVFSEGPACRVRLSTFDHEFCFTGD
ncbi:hypothetical protein THTE_1534 [Thermogutta terrifontis]|uniref:Uncharacterized protein n=1 Tax=Thermogutta terrifontis TaxID=1331910 RepID=A0A286RDU4_9BACT|nr:hypothetical protein THTE_1534 [Thermogutta terrifontis]